MESEPVNVIIDSGATCNLMSEQVFDKLSKGVLQMCEAARRVRQGSEACKTRQQGRNPYSKIPKLTVG